MRLDAADACVRFLDDNRDYAVAKGRMVFFRTEGGKLNIHPHRGRSRAEVNIHSRLVRHMANFTPTMYAVHRRAQFIESCERTLKATENVIFWQYLLSCVSIIQGKLKTIDDFFYLREGNPEGWQETLLRERDPDHWPYLVVSPEFSRHLGDFRAGVLATLDAYAGPTPEGFSISFEDALVWLMRHGLSKTQLDPEEEEEKNVSKRFGESSSVEHKFLMTCMTMLR